jgi:hypothetical protein
MPSVSVDMEQVQSFVQSHSHWCDLPEMEIETETKLGRRARDSIGRSSVALDAHLHGSLSAGAEHEKYSTAVEQSTLTVPCHEEVVTDENEQPLNISENEQTTPTAPCHEESIRQERSSPDTVTSDEVLVSLSDRTGKQGSSTGDEDDSSFGSMQFLDTGNRTVHFADESGLPLKHVRILESEEAAGSRVVVLLLSPKDRTFEFLHAEYELNETTTVQVLLEQLPTLATNEVFRDYSFSAIFRKTDNVQLINCMLLEDCGLEESEMVIAVLDGYLVPEIVGMAAPLLANRKITKAVSTQGNE